MVATQLRNTSITAFTDQGAGQGGAARHAVIMDEVDGMSGNEDRGGMQVRVCGMRGDGGYPIMHQSFILFVPAHLAPPTRSSSSSLRRPRSQSYASAMTASTPRSARWPTTALTSDSHVLVWSRSKEP